MIKQRPIMFSGQMVRSILDGRKTQTRRVIAPRNLQNKLCPYGAPGSVLWVRETWAETDTPDGTPVVVYRAGGCIPVGRKNDADYLIHNWGMPGTPEPGRWKPSIHMPRWASRILLEITDVRVQRLQDITEEDAIEEGIERLKSGRGFYNPTVSKSAVHFGVYTGSAKEAFRLLWEKINAKRGCSWETNPWVLAITFKRVA
ncbi:MAG: hypothetical protein LBE32_05430 [Burkholderiales bacterium]|jgi:hypothetical protein|nr:hypothetical protein [Burkholderiales bacterium]